MVGLFFDAKSFCQLAVFSNTLKRGKICLTYPYLYLKCYQVQPLPLNYVKLALLLTSFFFPAENIFMGWLNSKLTKWLTTSFLLWITKYFCRELWPTVVISRFWIKFQLRCDIPLKTICLLGRVRLDSQHRVAGLVFTK